MKSVVNPTAPFLLFLLWALTALPVAADIQLSFYRVKVSHAP